MCRRGKAIDPTVRQAGVAALRSRISPRWPWAGRRPPPRSGSCRARTSRRRRKSAGRSCSPAPPSRPRCRRCRGTRSCWSGPRLEDAGRRGPGTGAGRGPRPRGAAWAAPVRSRPGAGGRLEDLGQEVLGEVGVRAAGDHQDVAVWPGRSPVGYHRPAFMSGRVVQVFGVRVCSTGVGQAVAVVGRHSPRGRCARRRPGAGRPTRSRGPLQKRVVIGVGLGRANGPCAWPGFHR